MPYAVHRAAVRGQGPYMLWLFWGEEETEMPLPNLTSGPDGVFGDRGSDSNYMGHHEWNHNYKRTY